MTPILDVVNRTFWRLLRTEILKYKYKHQPTTDANTNTLLVTAHTFSWLFKC